MNHELERYFHHVYRNTSASFIPQAIPEFRNKAEIDAWFYQLERKDALFAEYHKNLHELASKQQEAIDNLVNAAKESFCNDDSEDITSEDATPEAVENVVQSQ